MSERDLDQEKVRAEHLAEIDQRAHWAYLLTVLLGGLLAMILLIAYLGS